MTGCIKPFNEPKFVEVDSNETMFLVPLTGATSDQEKFESVDYLKSLQVATKRVQIAREWVQTGRFNHQGEYIDSVRPIIVDRTPVNREWFNDAERSSSGKSEGFIGESKDSIKFKIGLTATAKVDEKDTATFLYQYSSKKSLAQVMDTEIRNKIGTVLLEQYGTMTMDEIRESKSEVIETVRKVVQPYFADFGITLSNIGYVGDLEYVDPKVQTAINEAFNAEQAQKAQEIKNKTEIDKAKAEAQANKTRQESMKEIVEMKELDLQQAWIERWNGELPQYIGGDNSGMIMNMPKEKQ